MRGELHRVHLDAHGRLLLAADRHQADAGDLRQARQHDILAIVAHRGERQRVGGEAQDQYRRIRGIRLAIKTGGWIIAAGRKAEAALIAACTSWATPSTGRLRLNCSVISAKLLALDEVSRVRPESWPNCCSRGSVTAGAFG